MILKLPEHYNANEWFVNIVLVFLSLVFACLPKKLPIHQIVLTMLFNIMIGKMADKVLGIKYPYDLYDTMDTPKYDLYDFLIYTVIYGIYGYIFAHFFVRFELKHKSAALLSYLLMWVGMSVFFERLAVVFEVFQYKSWNLAFSALAYFIFYSLQTFFFLIVDYYTKKGSSLAKLEGQQLRSIERKIPPA
ncbi:hypothetical protein [Paenibacillus sp. V4I5]|uniref:hypothetical protein n=1 Tax=Paenibacillus sp. V4I5 TaxID=3042306 RepID=UPI00278DF32A|nr:hypothetical protein [Paenibacillus sp. V4I5]MDQ0914698.1 hypothetical protein [Paenibacillus sp. V4I5]